MDNEQSRPDINQALIPAVARSERAAFPSGEQLFDSAVDQLISARRSKPTRLAYTHDVLMWRIFTKRHAVDPLAPSLRAAVAFKNELAGRCAPGSVCRTLAALSSIYSQLIDVQLVRGNVFRSTLLERPVNTYTVTPAASDADYIRMRAAAGADVDPVRGARDVAMLALLYETGMRRASAAGLELERLDMPGSSAQVTVKGGRLIAYALPEETRAALAAHLAKAQPRIYVFEQRDGGPLNVGEVNRLVARLAAAAGATHITPHSFRAGFATAGYDAIERGELTEKALQEALGHKLTDTTRRYDRKNRGKSATNAIAKARAVAIATELAKGVPP